MVIDDIIDAAGYLYNNLQTFINYWTKGMQILLDSEYDPADDNEHEIIAIPTQFYATFYKYDRAKTFTHAYDSWEYGNGDQPFVFCGTIKLENNVLEITNVFCLEKQYTGAWTFLDATQITNCENFVKCYPLELSVYSDYPTQDTVIHYYGGDRFGFEPNGYSVSNIGYNYTDVNGGHSVSPINFDFISGDFYYSHDVYIDYDFGLYLLNSSEFRGLYGQPFIMVSSDLTAITTYITNNGAVNNYSEQITTGDGDPFTVYYGDNYILYYIPTGNKLSYDDIYLTTQNITNIIVRDNPSMQPIHVPSYKENKYGPEPDPIIDDDYVDMGLGVETDGMAMYNMAVITRDDLIALITDFETNADTGLSFIPHVLGLYKLGFESSVLLTTNTDKIRLHKEPNGTSAFTSAADYNIVKDQEVLIDCGSITVDRKELLTNTFLDFSPYTTYEMFIPGCGWITLPDTIVGRTISVSIVFDLTTCSCKGVVRSEGKLLGGSGTTLATVNGIIGSSVPLSINETGLQRAAIMNGSTQAAMALGTAFMGVGIGNPYMGASGVAMAASALASNHIAGNSTYTSTKGGATDYSVFGDGWKAVLKITRPVLEIPDNYGHSVGFVVNRYDTLTNFSGFTVCVNPHIHISATSDEKEEIKRLLEEGVILPEGE